MNFIKKPIVIAVVIMVVILGAVLYFIAIKKNTAPEFIVVKKGAITQEVSVTGNVKPITSVDLAFETGGKISEILAHVGNFVGAGQIIARQDDSQLSSQLDKARADLTTQQAELDKQNIVLTNAYSSVINVLNDSYTKADDAVRNQVDAMFTNGETDNPQLNFTSNDSQAITDSRNGRLASRAVLTDWNSEINSLDATSQDALYQALVKSQKNLSTIRNFLVSTMDALNQANGLSSSTSNTYKTDITTARDAINTAQTNVTNQIQTINSQKATVISDEASVKSYQAGIRNIESQIAQKVLRSPINGIITKQDAKTGEIAVANTALVSILSSIYEIEAFIPEVDIAKIKIGDSAKTTLDAYGKEVAFDAKVVMINPAETMVEGVATYKTTLRLVANDKPVKSGMTANVDILTVKKDGVLIIPQRAVFGKNGDKFVVLYDSSKDGGVGEEIKITTGVRGSDGNIEILEGLKEGDKITISQ